MNFSEKISLILTILGTALSVIGILLTIKSMKDAKKLKTISWEQLQSACKDMAKHIKHHFVPDIIITPGQKGGIIAQMVMDILDIEIPIYTGFLTKAKNLVPDRYTKNYISLKTTKWNIFLPKCLEDTPNAKILIIDDFVMSGDFLIMLTNKLKDFGYAEENIYSCCVVTTKVAIQTKKNANYYWNIIDADNSYFPWGKVR